MSTETGCQTGTDFLIEKESVNSIFLRRWLCGESGIRTHGTLTDTLPFQGSQFNRSCISPVVF
jgi:hypothetical protein